LDANCCDRMSIPNSGLDFWDYLRKLDFLSFFDCDRTTPILKKPGFSLIKYDYL
jgi:hypothetical protein